MILVDTNVLLRSAQPGHLHFTAAKNAVKTARLRGYTPCIVPQVIYEYWVVTTRPLADNGLGVTTVEAEVEIEKLIEQFHFYRDERAIFDRWQQLVVQHKVSGKTGHDARLVAAMERHQIKHLISFNDQHFHRFPSISVIHPDRIDTLQ
ncbi:MAG: PIN domain-containing protein [Planctomycetota bacterium]|nr:PIN domain-containing protein [Planctomycetota bacterium]